MIYVKNLKGITVGELMESLKDVPKNTMICTELLTENIPIKVVTDCNYHKYYVGRQTETYQGILIK